MGIPLALFLLTAPACTDNAVVFVVDRSGSMSGAPLEAVKEATLASTRLLGPNDCSEVIAFDSTAALVPDVAKLTAGGGTNIQPALDLARAHLATSKAKHKHVLLLTDGQSPKDGLAATADGLAKDGATLSTIALGDDTDEKLLSDLATRGHGVFFKSKAPSLLKVVFEKDIRAALKPNP